MNSVCHVGNPVGNDMAFTRLCGAVMLGYYIVVDSVPLLNGISRIVHTIDYT
jgi:hypothetical protein